MKMTSIQIVLGLASMFDLEAKQMHVNTVFLNGFVGKNLYGATRGFCKEWKKRPQVNIKGESVQSQARTKTVLQEV